VVLLLIEWKVFLRPGILAIDIFVWMIVMTRMSQFMELIIDLETLNYIHTICTVPD